MKMVQSLLLGSAAGLLAVGGAQAADLPVKAKAVEYVRICSLYGAGFFYIPGTDTCIKLGGYLRADVTYNGGIYDAPFWNGEGGIMDRYANKYNDRSRLALTVDTRTATEYGVVRTFGQADFQFSTFGSTSAIGFGASLFPGAINGQVNNDTAGNGYVAVELAFVQFAGFTFGKSASAFSSPWHGYPGNNTSFLVGGYDTVTGINNIQYSWQFGNGVSATVGVDDSSANQYNRTQIINGIGGGGLFFGASAAGGGLVSVPAGNQGGAIGFSGACSAFYTPTGCAYGGAAVPDFVGNIRVDQAWGLFQIAGAIHDDHAGYFEGSNLISTAVTPGGFSQTGFINFGHPSDKFGGAVQASLQIKNLPTGAGDDIKLDGAWSLGASKYVLGTSSADPSSFDIYKGTRFASGVVTDAIYSGNSASTAGCVAGGAGNVHLSPALGNGTEILGCNGNVQTSQQLTRGWGFRGAFNHNWDPYWSSSLFGGIAGLSYNQTAKQIYCNTYVANAGVAIAGGGVTNGGGTGGAFTPGSVCDPGFTISMIGLVTRWTPVKNLTFSVEALYAYLKTNMSGGIVPVSAASGAASGPSSSFVLPTPPPGGAYLFGNNGTASINFRVQRNF
jgi:Porin subfamily